MNNKTGCRKERQRGKRGRETDIQIDLQNGQVLAYAVLCACAKNKNQPSYIWLVTNYARNLILTSPVLISPKPSKKEKLIRNAFFFRYSLAVSANRFEIPKPTLKNPNMFILRKSNSHSWAWDTCDYTGVGSASFTLKTALRRSN